MGCNPWAWPVEGIHPMTLYPTLRRRLLALATVAVFAVVVLVNAQSGRPQKDDAKAPAGDAKPGGANQWLMWGGSDSRNMVNVVERGVPTEWDVEEKKPKTIKWTADLGSKADAGPVIANGRIL